MPQSEKEKAICNLLRQMLLEPQILGKSILGIIIHQWNFNAKGETIITNKASMVEVKTKKKIDILPD